MNSFNGEILSVNIYDHCLTAKEIDKIMYPHDNFIQRWARQFKRWISK